LRVFIKWLGCALLVVSVMLKINVGHAEQIHPAVNQSGIQYKIDRKIQNKYPELIQLMLNTESMNENDRQLWFNQLPSMSQGRIDDLYHILADEKKKLEPINKEIKALKAEKKRRADLARTIHESP